MRINCTNILVIVALASGNAAAMPAAPPEMQAQQLTSAPVIDGNVRGDAAWDGAVPAREFWQVRPDAGQPATQATEVFIGFTDSALYIGVVAYDDNPDGIIVTDSRRDSSLQDTDAFLVIIDGLLDQQNGYVFGTNAASVEYDAQVTKEGEGTSFGPGVGGFNLNWDGNWIVRSRIAEHGWSAEFEIPFRTLRYGSAEIQTWGINFQRNIRRNNEVAYWAPLEINHNLYRVSDAGTLTGVAPPRQRNLKITPYVLGKTREGGELAGTESDSDVGFDLKYSITPSLTLDLTYNTDFAQVEVDDQQINLDRFNLFFPEKRPFFLENAGQFTVGNGGEVDMFFSRRIGISEDGDVIPVDGGVRLSGKLGSTTNVGFLHMSTDAVAGIAPGNNFTVARVNQELPNRSSIGAIIVSRDGDGSFIVPESDDTNQTYAIDGRWGIGDDISLEGWVAKTATPGLTGRDHALAFKAFYSTPDWFNRFIYTEVGEDFNPEVGFLSRTDFRKAEIGIFRRIRPDDLWGLLEIRPHASYTGHWKFDGFHESGFLHIDSHWEFLSGTEVHTGVNFTKAGVIDPFEIIEGVIVQPGTYDHTDLQLIYFTNQSKPLSFNIHAVVGGKFGGDRVAIEPSVKYRIGETFRSELSFAYTDFDLPVPNGEFTANLAKLRLSYSFTPKMTLDALVQYNEIDDEIGTNIRFSWLQSANSGLFLVYNEVDDRSIGALPTGREFIVKYSHIFDVFN